MSTNNQIDRESQKDPETLEREIDQQRAEIGHIVEELENKLSPGEMIDRVIGYAKGNGGEFFGNLGNTVKANPVPMILTSVGLAWMMAGQNRSPQPAHTSTSTGPSAKDKLSEKSGSMKARAGEMRSALSDSIGGTKSRVSDSSRRASEGLRSSAGRARGGFERMRSEQPLALGAIGIAVGALLAASMPPTRREDEMLGETRDRMADQLQHKAEEGYQKASAKGEEMASQMKQDRSNGQTQHAAGPH